MKRQPCEEWKYGDELYQTFWNKDGIKKEIEHAFSTMELYDEETFNTPSGSYTDDVYEELDHYTKSYYHPEPNSEKGIFDRQCFMDCWKD